MVYHTWIDCSFFFSFLGGFFFFFFEGGGGCGGETMYSGTTSIMDSVFHIYDLIKRVIVICNVLQHCYEQALEGAKQIRK